MIALLLATSAQVSSPPPPIVMTPTGSKPSLISFAAGTVRCGAALARPVFAPAPNLGQAYASSNSGFPPVTLRFAIDASGQPIGTSQPETRRGPFLSADDLAPTLATWRFAPGEARAGCTISFIPSAYAVTSAPIEMIHRAHALPHTRGPAETAIVKRLSDAANGCFTPKPPAVLNRAYPDFEAIAQAPGTSSYAMVGFDIDAKGRVRQVRILSSEGNAALDAAAIRAVRDSRFGAQARTGCSYSYHRNQRTPVEAPPVPEAAQYRKPGANCDESAPWVLPPRLTYPIPFRRRAIEGWAVIGYDVAPWGATGNVQVLASEPAAAFGDTARGIVMAARRPTSATGATGCVDRVIFRLPDGPGDRAEPDVPPPF